MAFLNKHNDDAGDIDVLLAKWVTRETDEQEYAAVEDWIAVSEENKMAAAQTYTAWDKSRGLGLSGVTDTGEAWERFGQRISATRVMDTGRRSVRLWASAAAAACLLIISFFIWNDHKIRLATPAAVKVASGAISRTDSLPDGSVVTLYPHAALSYDSPFAASPRLVSLAGDAFFSVAPDAHRPFRVSVRDLLITVTGTRFSVASKPYATEISVYRGSVLVSDKKQQETLSAREKLVVPLADSPWIKRTDSAVLKGRPQGIPMRPAITQPGRQSNTFTLPRLVVGDEAPILPLDKWIKGGPLNPYEKGKVYLIDFWALWCGPCISGMPHLSALQQRYGAKGLEVMSVTSADAWGNSYEKVKAFIAAKGDTFNYAFAWLPDSWGPSHRYRSIIYAPWLELAYDSSTWAMPQIFLLDRRGRIAFIGDGYELTEDLLVRVLNDQYDTARTRKEYLEKITLEAEVDAFTGLLDKKEINAAITTGKVIAGDPLVTGHTLLYMADLIFNKYAGLHSPGLLQLGMKAADAGVRVTASRSPGHLAVLAKGYSMTGRPEMALATIRSAISLSEGDFRTALEKDLAGYEKAVAMKNGH